MFNYQPELKLISTREVLYILGIKKSKFYLLKKEHEDFPEPVQHLSKNRNLYVESEIVDWTRKQALKRGDSNE